MNIELPALEVSQRQVKRIPRDKIEIGRLNMRSYMDEAELSELATSMSQLGQHTPISVFQTDTGYELVFGHRRCAAAELLGWTHIDGFIEDRDNLALWSMAWSENHARADISPTDRAEYLDKMRCSNGWTQAQLCAVTGMGESQVSDILGILRYPEPLREALDAGAISLGVARALHRIDDAAVMVFYLAQACEYGCTARAAEEWVRNYRLSQMTERQDDELVDGAAPGAPQNGAYIQTCTACLQPSEAPMTLIAVCPSCAATIRNPG